MIKSIRLKNFESHKDSFLEFDKGFNLICGLSDTGKSSIMKALSVITSNSFDKDMVSVGFAYCEIEVVTDRGTVTCQRGEEINRWTVIDEEGKTHSFDKVGRKVPELASKILGMKEKVWGKKLSELPNFIFQQDKHYMISEIGGEKSSSNMIARLIDGAIGLGGMEELIKEMSGDLMKNKKQLTEYTSKISETKIGLETEEEMEKIEKKLQRIKELFEELKNLNSTLEEINAFLEYEKENKRKRSEIKERLDKLQNLEELLVQTERAIVLNTKKEELVNTIDSLRKTQARLSELENVEAIQQGFETLVAKVKTYSELVSIKEERELTEKKLSAVKDRLKLLENFNVENLVLELEGKLKISTEINLFFEEKDLILKKQEKITSRLKKLENLSSLENDINFVVEKISKLEEVNSAYELYCNTTKLLEVNKEKLEKVSADLEKNLLEESNLRKTLKVCPICETPFSEEHKC